MTSLRRLEFSVDLVHPVQALTQRRGWLLQGAAGWAEWSPLPTWTRAQAIAAYRGAVEAAEQPFPSPVRDDVDINMMVPRVPPAVAARLAVASGCATVKVKVGDPESESRVRAVREAVGARTRIRLDANGSWDLGSAAAALRRLAAYDIELVEDPVTTMEDLATLRRSSPIRVAAEMCIRTQSDVLRLRRLDAADALVIKPQRIGGISAAMRAAEVSPVPVIISSALETSVGLASVLAVAAAIPPGPFAHGIGTALLLRSDVTMTPLVPVQGRLRPRRVTPDRLVVSGALAG